ncbi:DDE-type integrase/transposase/recombinase [Desulfobacula sp.]|uniref:helix-turn-helix domain-containing protein n=1 Tax=Desulfobacula sp. TaxID=2593537 RepID=UPI002634BF1C|nr:DDE-type integrase/transposase/recombinase [Desulfobacula sp.]
MKEQNDKKFEIALWRYGIISPLLHKDANDIPVGELLDQASLKRYVHPDGLHVSLSAETLRKWRYRYLSCGLPGLTGKERSDKGKHQIPDDIRSAMYAMREEHPRWTTAKMIIELTEKGKWNGRSPSRSAIYRFAKEYNLQRDPHINPKQNVRPFAFDHFGQLWMADFLHGPKLFDGKKKHKTYLHIILDDSSRFIVHGGFYLTESVEPLIYDLMGAVRRFGIPQRFYVDNGSAYISRHLKILCARNGIDLVHSPPFQPQGRGKSERLFRTVRDQFLCDKFKTVNQVNDAFKLWVSRYHETIHSSLNCSPLQKRLQTKSVCRALSPSIDIDALFRMERRCRVYNDCTIRFKKIRYEVPDCLPGSRVTIYYMPWDRTCIYYGSEMKKARIVDLNANARRFEHPNQ